MALNAFDDRTIDTLFTNLLPELYKAKGLVIDLRYNGGGSGSIATAIFKYLTNDKRIEHARSYTRQHIAAYKAWGADVTAKDTANSEWRSKSFLYNRDAVYYSFDYSADSVDFAARRIVVPTVILMGHGTASAAEDFLISAAN